MLTFNDREFADRLEAETGERPQWEARSFPDLEHDVRDSIRRIKDSPFVPHNDMPSSSSVSSVHTARPSTASSAKPASSSTAAMTPLPAASASADPSLRLRPEGLRPQPTPPAQMREFAGRDAYKIQDAINELPR
jgi:hypothetical protein